MRKLQLMIVALLALAAVCAAALNTASAAQEREGFKNLKYFPEDISRRELLGNMRDFAFALGVACTHCHGTEEQTGFDLRGVDFSLDIKEPKLKAREMLLIVEEINNNLLTRLPSRGDPEVEVECFTCHSGMTRPRMIEDIVVRKVEAEGVEAAIAHYRQLRERNYGNARYNFAEQPLVEAASMLARKANHQAALEISRLNLEFFPESSQSLFGLARAHQALGRKQEAIEAYEKLLEKRPNHRSAKRALEALKGEKD